MDPIKPAYPLVRRARQGLTLVEIMVVIAILGILMTVLGGTLIGRIDDANVEATKIQMKNVEKGLQLYAVKHKGKYPSTSEGLEAAAKYFPDSKVPNDAWDNGFQYFSPGTHGENAYEIISLGKDGAEGGEDADADIHSWNMNGEEEG